MAAFGGWLFGLALELQDGLGESPLRAGLTFVPCGVAFAIVSMNWRRLPARYHARLPMIGFVVEGAAGWSGPGLLLHSGGTGGVWLYAALAVSGAGMAGAFGALMGRVLSRVPVAIAADASGVVVTVTSWASWSVSRRFGSLYLNLAGKLPATAGARQVSAFALSSGHAYLAVTAALAALAVAGAALAWRTSGPRRPPPSSRLRL